MAISGIGDMLNAGFPILSTKIALVLSSMAAANDSGLSSVTNLTPIPNFLKVTVECWQGYDCEYEKYYL